MNQRASAVSERSSSHGISRIHKTLEPTFTAEQNMYMAVLLMAIHDLHSNYLPDRKSARKYFHAGIHRYHCTLLKVDPGWLVHKLLLEGVLPEMTHKERSLYARRRSPGDEARGRNAAGWV